MTDVDRSINSGAVLGLEIFVGLGGPFPLYPCMGRLFLSELPCFKQDRVRVICRKIRFTKDMDAKLMNYRARTVELLMNV